MHQSFVVDVAQISQPRAVSLVKVVDVPEPHEPDPCNLELSRLLVAQRSTRPRMTVMLIGRLPIRIRRKPHRISAGDEVSARVLKVDG